MIKLLRVDHRLLHGQVAFSWTQNVKANCLLIANDNVIHDDLRKTTLKLAKPNGMKLVFKSVEDGIAAINSGVTDKYDLFIVVETITDAIRLVQGCACITSINIGGTRPDDASRKLSKTVWITREEEEGLRKLMDRGVEVEIRQVPSDKRINVADIL